MESAEVTMPWDCLELTFNVEKISADGRRIKFALSDAQIKNLQDSLDVQGLVVHHSEFLLRPVSGKRFALTGKLSFIVRQSCIVSLEEISSSHVVDINVQFWPGVAVARSYASQADAEPDPLDDDEPEQIEAGIINVGRYLYEFMATSINPYPRKDTAEFNWQDKNQDQIEKELAEEKPFAALKILQKNGKEGEK